MRLWIRDIRVTFEGDAGQLVVAPDPRGRTLRIEFHAVKNLSGTPNKAVVMVSNLSAESRLRVQREFDRVRIEAGHVAAGNRGIVFEGFIRDVRHQREDADIVTTVHAGDGDLAYRQAVISETMPAGTTPAQVVDRILEDMPEVARGVIQGLDGLPAYTRPVVLCGPCRVELDKIGRTHRLYWSVQEGALEVVPGDGFIDDVVVLSRETGLIGVPDVTDSGVRVTAILNPQIRVGRVIEVRSETLEMNEAEARYRVSQVVFNGDTHADQYYAQVDGERIDGDRVVED